jgi:hypothetical protein
MGLSAGMHEGDERFPAADDFPMMDAEPHVEPGSMQGMSVGPSTPGLSPGLDMADLLPNAGPLGDALR